MASLGGYLRLIQKRDRRVFDPQFIRKAMSFEIWRIIGSRGYRKFIVLARPRTGSYMLIAMLDSHPSINAKGEILRHLRKRTIETVLGSMFYRYPPSIKAVGFKIMYHHLLDDRAALVSRKLKEFDDLHVIYLKRTNILRRVVSEEIAKKTGVWRDPQNRTIPIELRRVHLSPDKFRREITETRQLEDYFGRLFADRPTIETSYEELVRDPEGEFRRVTDFLGVEFRSPRIAIQKQNPEMLRDILINHEELVHAFVGTEWAPLFEQ